MTTPHAFLRVGLSNKKTLGMRILTNTPSDLTIGADNKLYVLCRGGQAVTFLRTLSTDDDDLLAFNFCFVLMELSYGLIFKMFDWLVLWACCC